MRRCVYAVIAVLLLSPFAVGRGGQRGARRVVIPANIRLPNVQNVPELMRFVRHPYDRTVGAIFVSSPSLDEPPIVPRVRSAAEWLPSRTPAQSSVPGQLKLMDSASDIIRCGYSPVSGCLPPARNYRTYVAY